MSKQIKSDEVKKVSCQLCRKEVPLSEAKVAEAADYVAYFCGLDCYAKWKRRSEQAGQKK
ncbi:MAG: DUF3330 domain-containing protein [Nitrosomonadales bacterium]|nr:DUF3330 domain-containing protein [Nitrosomonadales bacterium]